MSWKERATPISTGGWRDRATEVEDDFGDTSALESGARGLAQGASLGFADEITGGVEALWQAANGDPATFGELYRKARDESRTNYNSAQKANPKSYLAGEIGGAVGTAFIPGLNAAKGASLLNIAGKGALTGGAAGLGTSEADIASGKDIGKAAGDTLKGAALGGSFAGGAGLLAKIGGKTATSAGSYIDDIITNTPKPEMKPNALEIIESAKKLGVKLTPGMLDNTGYVERMENMLSKSPSVFGQAIKGKQDAAIRTINEAAEGLTSEASHLSPYQLGEKFKSGVTAHVGEKLDPLTTVFDEVAESTKNIPLSERSLNAVKRNIENIDVFRLTGGEGKASKYAEMIPKLKNADQVKTAMTLLNSDISAAQGAEKRVLLAIKEKLSNLEKNSIMRSAINTAKEARMSGGDQIGRDLVNDLKQARAGYRDLSKNLTDVAENARLKTQHGPSAFLDSLEAIPSEKIQDKFFNVENNRQLMNLQKNFPEQFDLLRQGKLKDILEASIDNSMNGQGKFNASKFLKEFGKLNDEAKEMLFKENVGRIRDIENVQRSFPRNFNTSNTASEQGWQNAIYTNARDLPNYALYRAASTNLGKNVTNNISELAKKSPELLGKFGKVLQEAEKRGPTGVPATHFILQSTSPEYREVLKRLAEDRDGEE